MAELTPETNCLFCRIVAGEIPCRRIHEDEHALAFLDVEPWHRGHSLVVPKRHVADVTADAQVLAEIAPAISAVSSLLVDRLDAQGLTMLSSAGAVAGQDVFHLHVHLVPRYPQASGLPGLLQKQPTGDLDEVLRQLQG